MAEALKWFKMAGDEVGPIRTMLLELASAWLILAAGATDDADPLPDDQPRHLVH